MDVVRAVSGERGLGAAEIEQYRRRGYLVLGGVVDRGDLGAAMDSLRTQHVAGRLRHSDRYNKAGRVDFRKVANLAKHVEAFRQLSSSPTIVAAVEALLGQPALIFRDV